MSTKLKFRRFNHHKDTSELVHEVSHWMSDLKFIKLELEFIKHLLKSFPFNKNSFNLFERIQLYTQRLDALHTGNTHLTKDIAAHQIIIDEEVENKLPSEQSIDAATHEDLAERLFEFQQEYVDFKREVYEYMRGVIK